LSTRRPASIGLRLLAAFTGIVGLEVVRYFAYTSEYQADSSLWFLIAGSIAFNSWFQWWTLPDTSLKAILSEAGLPAASRIVAKAVVALLTALAPLISPR